MKTYRMWLPKSICPMRSDSFKALPKQFDSELSVLTYISTAGFMIGLNVALRGPEYFHSTYPEGWQREYETNNYMFIDPMVYWGMTRTGTCRWSEIALTRATPVFKRAKAHGLEFGATISTTAGGRRSLLSVARADRELADDELTRCSAIIGALAVATFQSSLTIEELETLKLVAEGHSQKEIAARLGVAEPTVKVRLSKSKDKLGARNTTHAVTLAIAAKLI